MNAVQIRTLRHRLGMTQQQFAAHVPCHISSVMDWERGIKNPAGLYRRRLEQIASEPAPPLPDPAPLIDRIRLALTDDLRPPIHQGDPNPWRGHSAHATNALWHLLGKTASTMVVTHHGEHHWFLRRGDQIIDPVPEDTPGDPIPYHQGKGCGMTKATPIKRAQTIIDRINQQEEQQS